jgi:hypothetical protein
MKQRTFCLPETKHEYDEVVALNLGQFSSACWAHAASVPAVCPCFSRLSDGDFSDWAVFTAVSAFRWSLSISSTLPCPIFHHQLHKYFSLRRGRGRLLGVCVPAGHDGSDVIFLNIRSSGKHSQATKLGARTLRQPTGFQQHSINFGDYLECVSYLGCSQECLKSLYRINWRSYFTQN